MASLAALVAASIAVVKALQLSDSVDVVRNSVVAAGLVIAVAGVGVLVEGGVLGVRFLNLGLLSIKISIFLIVVQFQFSHSIFGMLYLHAGLGPINGGWR